MGAAENAGETDMTTKQTFTAQKIDRVHGPRRFGVEPTRRAVWCVVEVATSAVVQECDDEQEAIDCAAIMTRNATPRPDAVDVEGE